MAFEAEMTALAGRHNPEAKFIVSLTDLERDHLRAVLNHMGMGLHDFVVETNTPDAAITQMRLGLLAVTAKEQRVVAIALELMM